MHKKLASVNYLSDKVGKNIVVCSVKYKLAVALL